MMVDGVEQLDVPTAEEWLHEGALLVDVREPNERAQASIPGSLFLPLSELSLRYSELPRDRPLILQCAAGGRSHHAAKFLQGHGFTVANLMHGIHGWHRMGRPLTLGD